MNQLSPAQEIGQWNATATGYPPGTVLDFIRAQAAATPDAVAIAYQGQSHSYRAVILAADRLAAQLAASGVRRGSVVGVYGLRSAELPVALLGIQFAGAAYLPLDPDLPPARLTYQAGNAGAELVLHCATSAPAWHDGQSLELTSDIWAPPATEAVGRTADGAETPLRLSPDDLAYVIYTSGSTGRPKGVGVPHAGLANRLHWMQQAYRLKAEDRVLQKTPFGFDVSVWEFFWPLMVGAALVIAEPGGHRDTWYLAELMEQERISTVHFVPSMLAQFLDEPHDRSFTALKRVICSGEALSPALVGRASSLLPGELHNLYGPTEASIDVTYYRCGPVDATVSTVPIGAPIANTQIHLLDRAGLPVGIGDVGEIHLAGVGLARGYLNQPGLTADRFIPNAYGSGRSYRTGDLGRWRADGQLEYLGRIDHQVKINGNRIELGEIEAALAAAPGVAAAVVVAKTIGERQLLAAYLQPSSGAALPGRAELRAILLEQLPSYMVPAHFIEVDTFPLTNSGKVDRSALPDPVLQSAGGRRRPHTPAERILLEAWRSVLPAPEISLEDDFVQLGGDSIRALQVAAEVRARGYLISPGSTLTLRTIQAAATTLQPLRSTQLPDQLPPSAYPLTAMQAGMLFHSSLDSTRHDYHLQSIFDMPPTTRADDVIAALQQVVDRHPSLRTVFNLDARPEPVQRVLTAAALRHQVFDLTGLPAEQREDEFDRLLAADLADGFVDLADHPPLRLLVVLLDDGHARAVLSYHHALLDGWSLTLLTDEWSACYQARIEGRSAALDPPVPFAHYVAYLRQRDFTAAEDYWTKELGGRSLGEPIQLSGGDPTNQALGTVEAVLDEDVLVGLRDLGVDRGVTFSSLIHTAWVLVLARYSRSDEVVLGSTVAGRPADLAGATEVLGNCINTVAMPVRLFGGERLIDLVHRVQSQVFARADHELVPLSRVAELAGHEVSALFNSIVVVGNYAAAGSKQLTLQHTRSSTGYPLVIDVQERRGATHCQVRFQYSVCDEQAAGWLLRDLLDVLQCLAAQPQCLLSELRLTERAAVIGRGPDRPLPWPAVATVHEAFEAQVDRTPDAVAVRHARRNLTFRELDERANQLAHRLRGRGVRRGDRVGVSLGRTPELMVSLLGVLKAGAAYVPLPPDLPAERIGLIAGQAGLRLVLSQEQTILSGPAPTVALSDLDLDDAPMSRLRVACSGADLVYLIFTSGSTGKPKGVCCEHRGVLNYLAFGVTAYDCGGGGAPLLSSIGFDLVVTSLFLPLLTGQCVRLLDSDKDPAQLIEAMLEHAPYSFVKCTPGHLELIAAQAKPSQVAALAGTYVVGGDVFSQELLERWQRLAPSSTIFNEYGQTEASVAVTAWRADSHPGTDALPIGTALPNTSVYILDPWHQPLAPGVVGEVYLGGIGCARGYHDQPALTADRFLPDPFGEPGARMYRTGDLGRWDGDGNAHFLGRIDTQLKIRGYRVEAGEIEAVLRQHPQVEQCVVIEQSNRLHAFVVVSATASCPDGAQLSAWASELLPSYMLPSRYWPLEGLPLNSNGKLDRARLAAMTAERAEQVPAGVGGGLVRQLCQIWADVLGVADVNPEENFFELGGDSLLTLRVASAARRAGLSVTPRLIFSHPSVAELLPFVIRLADEPDAVPYDSTNVPLTPIQAWFLGLELTDPQHFNQSVVLEFDEVEATRLAAALDQVIRRHEALRLRFSRHPDGWQQCVLPPERAPRVRVSEHAVPSHGELAELATRIQGGLNPLTGHMVAAGILRQPGQHPVVVLAAHHLGVDTLSWPVLLADLTRAYSGESLLASGVSFAAWAHALAKTEAERSCPAVPAVRPAGRSGDVSTLVTRLDPVATGLLTRDVPARCGLRVEDVLVTALLLASAGPLLLDLERHGREDLVGQLDVTDSVGWFTSVFPLELAAAGTPLDTVLEVKDRLRRLHGAGSSVHSGRVVLNYHGRNDHHDVGGDVFRWLPGTLGEEKSPRQQRTHQLEVEAAVRQDQLELEWIAAPADCRASKVSALAARFDSELRALLDALAGTVLPPTPADFPLLQLSQTDIGELLDHAPGSIADIYPLSPMQSGMVMHSLISEDGAAYTEQHQYELAGLVDEQAFLAAWQRAIDRHPALRSVIYWDLPDGPVQVVLSKAELDWQIQPELADPASRETWAAADRARGFDFAARPPVRLAIARTAPDRLQVSFSFHHAVLDGWSVAVLMDEILTDYRARLRGMPSNDAPPPALATYVAYRMTARPPDEREFWQAELAGFHPGPQLPPGEPCGTGCAVQDLVLDEPTSDRLRAGAGRAGLTLSTLAHAAWAAVLVEATGRQDVVFGSTVAGRSAPVEYLDQAVGMFMNTLPARVTIPEEGSCRQWLADVQRRHALLRSYEYSSLVEIADWAGVPSSSGLFDSIVAVENIHQQGLTDELCTLRELHSSDATDYPLTVLVFDTSPIRIRIAYQNFYTGADGASRLATAVAAAMVRLIDGLDEPVISVLPAGVTAAR